MKRSPHVEVERNGLVAIVRLQGSASILEAEPLLECLDGLIAQEVRRIFVDMTEMDYGGCLAVAGIVAGYAKTHQQCRIRVLPPPCIAGNGDGAQADQPGQTLTRVLG